MLSPLCKSFSTRRRYATLDPHINTFSKATGQKGVHALVLVPTTDLAFQVRKVVAGLLGYCSQLLHVVSICSDQSVEAQKYVLSALTINAYRPRLSELPDIIVATPGRLVQHLEKKVEFSTRDFCSSFRMSLWTSLRWWSLMRLILS